jgi:hypothetical protein
MGEAKRSLAKVLKPMDLERITFLMDQPFKQRRPAAETPAEERGTSSPPATGGLPIDAPP